MNLRFLTDFAIALAAILCAFAFVVLLLAGALFLVGVILDGWWRPVAAIALAAAVAAALRIAFDFRRDD